MFFGQDASYNINTPSFTKLDDQGNALSDHAGSWSVVRDNVTGLIWSKKTNKDGVKNYANPHDADNTYTWYDSNPLTNGGDAGTPGAGTDTQDYISDLNSSGYGGYSDWRIPTPQELLSIMNFSRQNPTVEPLFFPFAKPDDYWSSATFADDSRYAWRVFFGYGGVYYGAVKSTSLYVRAVRGGQMASQLMDNGDGTITDVATGLMWQKQDDGVVRNWEDALGYCESLLLAGHEDWRMPTAKELSSIVRYDLHDPALHIGFFPGTQSGNYWSSTTDVSYTDYAWIVNSGEGYVYDGYKQSGNYVRAVRGGQDRLTGHLYIKSPAQADLWEVGQDVTITWDTAGIGGDVRVLLSRDGGISFVPIVAAIANTGSLHWTVSGPESSQCVLMIEPVSDLDKSAALSCFSIYDTGVNISGVSGRLVTTIPGYTRGVLDATVVLEGTDISATTPQSGSFTLMGIPHGTYTLKATAANFSPHTQQIVVAEDPQDLGNIELEVLGDTNGDGKLGLEDAIRALQTVGGLR